MTVTIEPRIREYLEKPSGKAEVEKLIDLVGGDPGAVIRAVTGRPPEAVLPLLK
jgi:hypothetical protein